MQAPSPERQKNSALRYCRRNGLPEPHYTFVDFGISGETVERDQQAMMWELVAKNPGQCHILVDDLARMTRDHLANAHFVINRHKYDVVVHDCNKGVLTEDQQAEDALFASRDRKNLSMKMRSGAISAALRNEYLYPTPFGYLKNAKGGLEICPFAGPLVREVVKRRLAGASWDSLAEYLNSRGAKTRRGYKWRGPALRLAMQNPAYTGKREYKPFVYGWEKRTQDQLSRAEALRKNS
jgi:hypothetical protein